jgi:hypothetical protein
MRHHGRFQAQGRGIELSEKWEQDVALKVADGHVRLNRLEQRLSGRERDLRANALIRMHTWINRVAAVGGLDGPYAKSILGQSGSRVDVEISRGKAFVP